MATVTLDGIRVDERVYRVLEDRARGEGASVAEFVAGLVRTALGTGLDQPAVKRRDLSRFAGKWTDEQAAAFDHELALMRRVDPEEWQ